MRATLRPRTALKDAGDLAFQRAFSEPLSSSRLSCDMGNSHLLGPIAAVCRASASNRSHSRSLIFVASNFFLNGLETPRNTNKEQNTSLHVLGNLDLSTFAKSTGDLDSVSGRFFECAGKRGGGISPSRAAESTKNVCENTPSYQ